MVFRDRKTLMIARPGGNEGKVGRKEKANGY